MDVSRFLSAAAQGDLATIKHFQSAVDSRIAFQACGSDGNNALHTALLHGKWTLALYLMREMRVSQHKLNAVKESVLHSYVRGVKSYGAPTVEDLAEFREEQLQVWREEYALNKEKEVAILEAHPEAQPIPIPGVEARDLEVFGNIELTLPRYFIESGHVYLYTKNTSGATCRDLAHNLSLDTLSTFFEEQMEPAAAKRRLLQGLSDDLFREVVEFL